MFVNKDYLVNQQYASQTNLQQRIAIHQFSPNANAFWPWVRAHYTISSRNKILEVGCGSGDFWQVTASLIPAECQILLTDLSIGMLQAAKQKLIDLPHFKFVVSDVEQLSVSSQSFDWVFAHYMLYHAYAKQTALNEIKRVLKPGGSIGILLPSKETFKELILLLNIQDPRQFLNFSAEIAMQILPQYFTKVNHFVYQDVLKIPYVEPVIAYLQSLPKMEEQPDSFYIQLEEKLRSIIKSNGYLELTVAQYLFIAEHK